MTIRPLHDQVFIAPIEDADRTKGGLWTPEVAKGKPTRGTVKFVGPGKVNKKGVRITTEVQVGDVVHYPMFVGKEMTLDKEDLVAIEESAIMAVEESE